MSQSLSAEELKSVQLLLGPWLVGDVLEAILQGVIFCQFTHYWDLYGRKDRLPMRIAVIGLLLITTLKTVQSFAQLWIQDIVYYGDLQGAIGLSYTKWWQTGNPMMVAAIGFYVQMFFTYRLYAISKSIFVAGTVFAVFVFALVSIIVATNFIPTGNVPSISLWFALHLSSVFAGDLLLSSTTAYFLIKSKKNVLPQMVGVLNALIRLTFQTAAPASICAMLNLIFSQVQEGGSALTSTAFNQMLPKLYAISMLWTLNARRSISLGSGSSSQPSTDANSRSRSRRNTRNPNEVELGIRVRTHVETLQVVDDYSPDKSRTQDMSDADESKADSIHKSTDF